MDQVATPTIRRGHQVPMRRSDEPEATPGQLVSFATRVLRAADVERSRQWLFRTANAFLASPVEGLPFGVFLIAQLELNARQRTRLAERSDLRYLLSYSDPTGETAIRHVMKERGF